MSRRVPISMLEPMATSQAPDPARDQPEILRIRTACAELGAIDLAVGIPESAANADAVAAAAAALHGGANRYADPRGLPRLHALLADELRRHNGLHYDPDSELFVSSGVTGGFAATVFACFRPGDEVIVPEPFFGWHVKLLELVGVRCRFVPLVGDTLELREADLRAALGPRTRALMLCTPANPSGKVYTRAELQRIAAVARERDLLVITDEQYDRFCFDGREHVSPASVEDLRERTVCLMGLSKRLSITGWRIGYVAAPAPLLSRIHTLHTLLYICPPTPLQHGVIAALEHERGCDAGQRAWVAELSESRELLSAALRDANFRVIPAQGGLFLLAEPPEALAARPDPPLALIEAAGVGAVGGRAFYSNADYHHMLRFCFARPRETVLEACARIRRVRTL